MKDCEQVLHLQPEEESPFEAQTSSELRDPEHLWYDGIQRAFFRNSDTPETYIFQRYVFAQVSHFIPMALRSANQDFLWGKKKKEKSLSSPTYPPESLIPLKMLKPIKNMNWKDPHLCCPW